jgi:hypothetical protein
VGKEAIHLFSSTLGQDMTATAHAQNDGLLHPAKFEDSIWLDVRLRTLVLFVDTAWSNMGCRSYELAFDCVSALGIVEQISVLQSYRVSWITQNDITQMQSYGLDTNRMYNTSNRDTSSKKKFSKP